MVPHMEPKSSIGWAMDFFAGTPRGPVRDGAEAGRSLRAAVQARVTD